nr:T cell receptor alpha chain MC.7.G5 isoform X4 [Taeniopygia guttata]
MWSALCVGFLPIVVSLAGAATLEQQPREVTVQEGNTVTLQCRMRGDSMRYYTMSWYRQGPTGSQEWIYKEDGTYGEGFKDRFKIKEEKLKNSFTLQILAAKQGDAATYYCRAKITWGAGGTTVTGPGTILTVVPKVILEKSTKSADGGTTVKTTPLPSTFHTENISSVEQNTERECTDKSDSSLVTILPDPEEQRVNMLSMAVLGLRVLLAKSIAFNTLMSIKLFLF